MLLNAFSTCKQQYHRSEIQSIWTFITNVTTTTTATGCTGLRNPTLQAIYNDPFYWKLYSQITILYLQHHDILTAMTWLSRITSLSTTNSSIYSKTTSININEHGNVTPLSSHEKIDAKCFENDVEPLVYRIYATFSTGSLGLRLQPYQNNDSINSIGCQVGRFINEYVMSYI